MTTGQTIKAEFTYENNGRNYQENISTGYYLSTNDYITTNDSLIKSKTLNLGRDELYTVKETITIPNSIASGVYWLDVIIDKDNTISEVTDSNNATYISIKVSKLSTPGSKK